MFAERDAGKAEEPLKIDALGFDYSAFERSSLIMPSEILPRAQALSWCGDEGRYDAKQISYGFRIHLFAYLCDDRRYSIYCSLVASTLP